MKNIIQHSILTTLLVALFLTLSPAVVAQTAEEVEVRPLFLSQETLNVRIEAPLSTLMKEQPDEEYLAGKFSYTDATGQEFTFDLKLQTRGRFRRNKSTCTFSPLRLNFPKKQLAGSEFAGQDKLKLVTHCQRSNKYEQLLLREFLAYRILHTLTDKSFGARLMKITYVDTEKNGDSIVKYGFVIEDEDDIGDRIGIAPSKIRKISSSQLDGKQANLVSVYEYLIGNTDFSLILGPEGSDCCHNAVLFSNGSPPHTPIPYDFDFSGLVDAPYASANPRFKLRSVKQRLYRGRCKFNEYMEGTFAYFQEKEPEIRQLIAELEGVSKSTRKGADKFVTSFYKDISDPKKIQRNFIGKCL
jgi:hypothetical protein